ncbi:hypothetical protein [Aggregatilinea lenta]|uniref:hypothetical protein n=1 Tax=Aggregatilinea lenta TaxID=913108 RepID=UPI000E5A71E9|nr:hypothetical protein [Aggregatilinea lenta]
MIILAGLVLIATGLSRIYLKDLWWFDAMVLQRAFGQTIERTDAWDRMQDRLGLVLTACGVFLLIYNALLVQLF